MRRTIPILACVFTLGMPSAWAQEHSHGHGAGEDHGHRSPHGGIVRSIGDYHVEVVFTPADGGLVLYVLGTDETSPLPIASDTLTAQCRRQDRDGFVQVSLAAAPQPGEGAGTASRFSGRSPDLKDAAVLEAVVHVPVGGKQYRAAFSLTAQASPMRYACPMACEGEKTYAAAGKCPVCGMVMKEVEPEHAHGGGPLHDPAFEMTLAMDPARPAAGEPVTLVFTPRRTADGSVVKELQIVHEKPLHLILVSRDLGWYAHEHPVPRADGSLALPFTFPAGGSYILFADITLAEGNQVFPLPVEVSGAPRPGPELRANLPGPRRIGDYEVTLAIEPAPAPGRPVTLSYTVRRAGKEVTDLQPYLGALGHCVFISRDGTQYLHSHPSEHRDGAHAHGSEPERGGPMVAFRTLFPAPGLYKGWAQFKHRGEILTADFVVEVPGGAAGDHGH